MYCVVCEKTPPDNAPRNGAFCVWCGHPLQQNSPYASNDTEPFFISLRDERNRPQLLCPYTNNPLLHCARCGRLYGLHDNVCTTDIPERGCYNTPLSEPGLSFATNFGSTDGGRSAQIPGLFSERADLKREVGSQDVETALKMAYRYGLLVLASPTKVKLYRKQESSGSIQWKQQKDVTLGGIGDKVNSVAIEDGYVNVQLPDRIVAVSLATGRTLNRNYSPTSRLQEHPIKQATISGWHSALWARDNKTFLVAHGEKNDNSVAIQLLLDIDPNIIEDFVISFISGNESPVAVIVAGVAGVFAINIAEQATMSRLPLPGNDTVRWRRIALRMIPNSQIPKTNLCVMGSGDGHKHLWMGVLHNDGNSLTVERSDERTISEVCYPDFAWSNNDLFVASPTQAWRYPSHMLGQAEVQGVNYPGDAIPGFLAISDRNGNSRLLITVSSGRPHTLRLFNITTGHAQEVASVMPVAPQVVVADGLLVCAWPVADKTQMTLKTYRFDESKI